MKPQTIAQLDELFRAMPLLVGTPVAREEIDAAEKQIGMPFDADYREFIARYGGAMVGSWPILGLRSSEVMGAETVLEVTWTFRADGWSPTEDWLVISVDLAGNPIGLNAKGEVWLSDHDANVRRVRSTALVEALNRPI